MNPRLRNMNLCLIICYCVHLCGCCNNPKVKLLKNGNSKLHCKFAIHERTVFFLVQNASFVHLQFSFSLRSLTFSHVQIQKKDDNGLSLNCSRSKKFLVCCCVNSSSSENRRSSDLGLISTVT